MCTLFVPSFLLSLCFCDSFILSIHNLFLLCNIISLNHNVFIHLPLNGHLDCFQFLTIVNKAAVNICVQVSAWASVLVSREHKPRSAAVGNSVFGPLRTLRTPVYSSCTVYTFTVGPRKSRFLHPIASTCCDPSFARSPSRWVRSGRTSRFRSVFPSAG